MDTHQVQTILAKSRNEKAHENWYSSQILDAAIEVHKLLGPGLLESIYEEALCQELILRGINVKRQVHFPVNYKGNTMQCPLVLDVLVANKVIVEVKATEKNHPIYKAQTLTYVRMTNLKLGLIINFGQEKLIDGFDRIVNGL